MTGEYTRRIKARIADLGADLVGVADTALFEDLQTDPADLLAPYPRAVSIAVSLPRAVFAPIVTQPTRIYSSVYQTANRLLDEIAFKASKLLQTDGYMSLPIPASQVLDKKRWHSAISHKAVARMAGLGWQGKNLLLITRQYGSRIRLVTILTRAPLEPDAPVQNQCGKCTQCQDACPVGAIKGINTSDHYASRNEALYFDRCVEKLTVEFAALPDIGAPICGICINACPFGQKENEGDV